jgi:hypothetical protein
MSNCDNWEDDWENDDDMDAKLKANIEETKRKEIQHLVDSAEEQLIEDLFLTPLLKNPLFTGVNPRKPPHSGFGPTFSKGWVEQKQIKGVLAPMMEKNANMKNIEKSSLNKDNEQKLLEQKKKQQALKKRQDELFGDASLDTIQDQYCDLEDRY